MRRSLSKTITTQILNIRGGDILVFTIGDVAQNLMPTDKDLKDFRKRVREFIDLPKDVSVAVFPPYVKTSVIRKSKKRRKRS